MMTSNISVSCSNAAVIKRKNTEIWLVDQPPSTIIQTKLPSKREVLRLFFHCKRDGKQTIKDIQPCHSTAGDVLAIWEKARDTNKIKKTYCSKSRKHI